MSWTKRYLDILMEMGYNPLENGEQIPAYIIKKAKQKVQQEREEFEKQLNKTTKLNQNHDRNN